MIITISHHFPFVQLKSRAFHGHNATYQATSVYQRQLGGDFLGQNTDTSTSTVIPTHSLPDISISGFPKNLNCYPWHSAGTSNAMLIYSSQVILKYSSVCKGRRLKGQIELVFYLACFQHPLSYSLNLMVKEVSVWGPAEGPCREA